MPWHTESMVHLFYDHYGSYPLTSVKGTFHIDILRRDTTQQQITRATVNSRKSYYLYIV